MKFSIILDT